MNTQQVRRAQIARFQDTCTKVFEERNRAYGDAIRMGGLIGAIVTLTGDTARAHNLMIAALEMQTSTPVPAKEAFIKLEDTLIDIANYAAIAVAMLEDENYWGGFYAPGPKEASHG